MIGFLALQFLSYVYMLVSIIMFKLPPPPKNKNKQLNYLRCTHFQSMTQSTIEVERR